jgi:transcriptional regulator with XRE-family HTH domain
LSPKNLGMKIKRLRKRRGLTQAELANAVGISRVHLANMESADNVAHHRKPSLPTLEKLAKALKVKLSEIV